MNIRKMLKRLFIACGGLSLGVVAFSMWFDAAIEDNPDHWPRWYWEWNRFLCWAGRPNPYAAYFKLLSSAKPKGYQDIYARYR